jgi:hypothetical protein
MIRKEKKWSGRKDLNLRPPGPEPGALARLRYAPTATLILQTKRELQLNTGTVAAERRFAREKGYLPKDSDRLERIWGPLLPKARKLARNGVRSYTAAQTRSHARGSKCWHICRNSRTYR